MLIVVKTKPGIEIALYLVTHFRKRNGHLHEFTNIYVTLHLSRRKKNCVDKQIFMGIHFRQSRRQLYPDLYGGGKREEILRAWHS